MDESMTFCDQYAKFIDQKYSQSKGDKIWNKGCYPVTHGFTDYDDVNNQCAGMEQPSIHNMQAYPCNACQKTIHSKPQETEESYFNNGPSSRPLPHPSDDSLVAGKHHSNSEKGYQEDPTVPQNNSDSLASQPSVNRPPSDLPSKDTGYESQHQDSLDIHLEDPPLPLMSDISNPQVARAFISRIRGEVPRIEPQEVHMRSGHFGPAPQVCTVESRQAHPDHCPSIYGIDPRVYTAPYPAGSRAPGHAYRRFPECRHEPSEEEVGQEQCWDPPLPRFHNAQKGGYSLNESIPCNMRLGPHPVGIMPQGNLIPSPPMAHTVGSNIESQGTLKTINLPDECRKVFVTYSVDTVCEIKHFVNTLRVNGFQTAIRLENMLHTPMLASQPSVNRPPSDLPSKDTGYESQHQDSLDIHLEDPPLPLMSDISNPQVARAFISRIRGEVPRIEPQEVHMRSGHFGPAPQVCTVESRQAHPDHCPSIYGIDPRVYTAPYPAGSRAPGHAYRRFPECRHEPSEEEVGQEQCWDPPLPRFHNAQKGGYSLNESIPCNMRLGPHPVGIMPQGNLIPSPPMAHTVGSNIESQGTLKTINLPDECRKVFVTYSVDTVCEIKHFVNTLRVNGFQTAIDIFEDAVRGIDIIKWMDSYLKDMQLEFIQQGSMNFRFIPVLFPNASKEHVPGWLQNTHIYRWPQDEKRLLLRLLREEEYIAPPVGKLPTLQIKPA
ncbi:UNVERIFIED_CONTAM: hypothetical protein FKN15_021092 [Acipenser sinensis]